MTPGLLDPTIINKQPAQPAPPRSQYFNIYELPLPFSEGDLIIDNLFKSENKLRWLRNVPLTKLGSLCKLIIKKRVRCVSYHSHFYLETFIVINLYIIV